MADPPEHLRPSGWTAWEKCPRSWARERIDGIVEPNGWESEVGTMAHAVLLGTGELPGLYNDPPERRTVERARQHAHTMATAPHPDRPPVTSVERGEITAADFKRKVWRSVLGDFEVEDPPEVDVVATELEVTWEEAGVPFMVHLDRAERLPALGPGITTIDFKTGKVPDRKYQGPYHRQVVIGSMAVAATMPEGPAQGGSLLYISQSETVAVDTSLAARTETLRAAVGVWEAITYACSQADTWLDFPPNVGPLCGWCPAAPECDAGRAFCRKAWSGNYKGVSMDAVGYRLVAEMDGIAPERF